MKIRETYRYAILISTGREYRALVGWNTLYASLAEAKSAAKRAERNSGWTAKVISMTPDEARHYGWRSQ